MLRLASVLVSAAMLATVALTSLDTGTRTSAERPRPARAARITTPRPVHAQPAPSGHERRGTDGRQSTVADAGREHDIAGAESEQEQPGFYPTWTMDPTSRAIAARQRVAASQGLGPDGRANDRNPTTCSGCPGLGIMQVEASVAVLGSNVVASWNEGESSCPGGPTRQNYGWSTDGGLTFTDGGGFPPVGLPGSTLFGDAVVAANAKTGKFYITGLMGNPPTMRGIGAVRGSFGPGGFTIELNKLVATSASLLDKDWVAVDSLTGNVYVMWTVPATGFTIMLQRLDADLNPLGPAQQLTTPGDCGGQWSQVATGPNGEVYVSWQTNHCTTDFHNVIRIRRSTDFGATFGPVVEAADYAINRFNGAPGFGRSFGATQQILAVDRSRGPHRGRLYLAYDACINYIDAPIPLTTTRFEAEPNNTTATANDLVPGGKLRGEKTGLESDWFRVEIPAGVMLYVETTYAPDFSADSTREGVLGRIWCSTPDGLVLAQRATITSNGILYTPQVSGTHYLELVGTSTSVSPYILRTALLTPGPSDVALDHRDQLLIWSDDGITWSPPIRLSDTPPGVEAQYPTAAVDARGRVFVNWMDFRGPTCGSITSAQYQRASGDGGLTWGPARLISDDVSNWAGPFCNQLNNNTQGDYQQSAADGDIVASAFTDTRFGDPDIVVDVSIHRELTSCSPAGTVMAGVDTTVDFGLGNGGNYERTLAWRVEDTRGWIAGALPALAGSQALAAGAPLAVQVTMRTADCAGESTLVRFITSDPAIPGYEDTCVTVVRCHEVATGVLASLASVEATPDRVRLAWYVGDPAFTATRAWRSDATSGWVDLGPVTRDGDAVRYEDATVQAGRRYAYRLELRSPDGPRFAGEAWVDVPSASSLSFALTGVSPNPSANGLEVAFSLPGGGGARLELYDLAGRRVLSRELGGLGAGDHRLRLVETAQLAAGVYTLRLVQGAQSASMRAVVVQ